MRDEDEERHAGVEARARLPHDAVSAPDCGSFRRKVEEGDGAGAVRRQLAAWDDETARGGIKGGSGAGKRGAGAAAGRQDEAVQERSCTPCLQGDHAEKEGAAEDAAEEVAAAARQWLVVAGRGSLARCTHWRAQRAQARAASAGKAPPAQGSARARLDILHLDAQPPAPTHARAQTGEGGGGRGGSWSGSRRTAAAQDDTSFRLPAHGCKTEAEEAGPGSEASLGLAALDLEVAWAPLQRSVAAGS